MELEDKTISYQRKVEALYADEAAANFKREFFPADPSKDGVWVDAANLDIPELVAIYRASKNLEAGGHLRKSLIVPRDAANLTPLVRVNPVFVDRRRQQKNEMCKLLHEFFYGDCKTFAAKHQEIMGMGDSQLEEFVRQVEESLGLTPRVMKVMEVIDES